MKFLLDRWNKHCIRSDDWGETFMNQPVNKADKLTSEIFVYGQKTQHAHILSNREKYYKTTAEKDKILNSRSELISTCRHGRKFLLSEYG